jgi:hypothetical protein
MQTTRPKQALVSHNIRIRKQVCSSITARNTELYEYKNITSLVSFGWIVSHWSLMSRSEYWTLTWNINRSVHWTLSVWKRFIFRVSSRCSPFVMVKLNLSDVSLRGNIFNYWLTNNIRVQILSLLQNRSKVEIVMVTVAVFDQIAM